MATAGGRPRPTLIERLFREPQRFRAFQAVRILEQAAAAAVRERSATRHPVGGDADPASEVVRFRALTTLAFPPAEVADLRDGEAEPDGAARPPEMTVTFMGLQGPSGVLPQHYTTLLIRSIRDKSVAMRDLFDLFNHRLVSLFVRSWSKYRLPIAYEVGARRGGDGATEALRGVVGIAGQHLRNRTSVADETLLHYAGHFSHFPRSAASLEAMLSDYFGRPIRVEQFYGRWLALAREEQTALPDRDEPEGRYCQLGVTATLGDRVWDVQSGFRLHIGPLDYGQFLRFMPDGEDLKRLAELTQLYVGQDLSFDVQLTLKKDAVPFCRLGRDGEDRPRLGWNTWLKHGEYLRDVDDAVFLRKQS